MKKLLLAVGLLSIAGTTMAAGKNCEVLQAEIDAKLKHVGVSAYTLTIVDRDTPTDKKVVGVCGAGTKMIIYTRGPRE